MFNFNLQNRAFEELNAEQFRMIYFLNNTLSMVNEKHNTPNNNKIEMFNGYMMDKLGLGIRMIQYHIKELEKMGYITVERPIGRNAAKKPNIITLNVAENNAINCALYEKETTNSTENNAINDAINCTLNKKEIRKNKKIINNIPVSTGTCKENKNIKEKNNIIPFKTGAFKGKGDNNQKNFLNMENNNLSGQGSSSVAESPQKENEMNDNGMNVMNAKSEMKWNDKQGSNNVAECGKKNEMTTSLATAFNKLQDQSHQEHSSIFNENCSKSSIPPIALPPLSPCEWDEDAILGAGCNETTSMGSNATQTNRTQPDAQEAPQIEFNEEWYNETYDLMDNFKTLEDLEEIEKRIMMNPNNKRMVNELRNVVNSKFDWNNSELEDKAIELVVKLRYPTIHAKPYPKLEEESNSDMMRETPKMNYVFVGNTYAKGLKN